MPYKHILVATDGSELCVGAIRAAVEPAQKFRARLTCLRGSAPRSRRRAGAPFERERHHTESRSWSADKPVALHGLTDLA